MINVLLTPCVLKIAWPCISVRCKSHCTGTVEVPRRCHSEKLPFSFNKQAEKIKFYKNTDEVRVYIHLWLTEGFINLMKIKYIWPVLQYSSCCVVVGSDALFSLFY